MTDTQAKPSDLKVRALSAIVMVVIAGGALWLGGWYLGAFVIVVGCGVYWEWTELARGIAQTKQSLILWCFGGIVYIGIGCFALLRFASVLSYPGELGSVFKSVGLFSAPLFLILVLSVIATDVGAYFAGRTIGGPKIAPKISPSKTWAGLAGATLATAILLWIVLGRSSTSETPVPMMINTDSSWAGAQEYARTAEYLKTTSLLTDVSPYFAGNFRLCLLAALVLATVAQAGDFFESWMKRRAGVKDSGSIIPGHGGLFDRTDGLIAVAFVMGCLLLAGVVRP